MGRYHRIEAAAYAKGAADTGRALLEFLRTGGDITFDRDGWHRNDIFVKAGNGRVWQADARVLLEVLHHATIEISPPTN